MPGAYPAPGLSRQPAADDGPADVRAARPQRQNRLAQRRRARAGRYEAEQGHRRRGRRRRGAQQRAR